MAFPLHVTTPATHVNRSFTCHILPTFAVHFRKGGATVRLQNGGC